MRKLLLGACGEAGLILATTLVACAFAAPPENLLGNGDFTSRPGRADALGGWWHSDAPACQAAVVDAEVGGFTKAVRVEVNPKPGGQPWDVQLSASVRAPLASGPTVRVMAWLRSPQSCPVSLTYQLSQAPYTNFANQLAQLTPQWKQYAMQATLTRDFKPGETAVCFHLGRQAGTVEIAGVRVQTVSDNPQNLIPFVLPWDDASPGVTNVSGWLDKPAGSRGFVTARDGHLFVGDKRIRFFGTNITTSAAFPSHGDAEKVAARLAKFGINCVRFHHMDATWSNPGILQADRRTFHADSLERLDYFIAQLKQNGIYTDLNLHVSREYADQPKWAGMPDFFKGLDNFFPPMIEMQREYARGLLTHVNPHTGKSYAEEPAVAFVEINNENGLLSSWWWGGLDGMLSVYRDELQRQWNEWLKPRYADEAALRQAWLGAQQPLGAELLKNGSFAEGAGGWFLEQTGTAKGAVEPSASGPDGKPALRVQVQQTDDQGWHVQCHQAGLKVEQGRGYTLSFQARANEPRTISVDCRQAHPPWQTLWETNVPLTSQWQAFRFVVTPSDGDDNARITFGSLGAKTGTVELAAASLRPGGGYELRPGDRLGQVGIVTWLQYSSVPPGMQRDWVRFLWDTEERYWTGMARFLQQDLGVHALIFGSAVGFSPVPIQAELDLVDAHSYWHHPSFPGQPWDANNWFVTNQSMAGVAGGGTLPGLALTRVAGKPFTVTEYNHPAPNTHNSEAFLLTAAYGALQDWDGLFSFAYQGGRDNWNGQRIGGYFDVDQHPTQMATLPAVAALLLRGDVSVPEQRAIVGVSPEVFRDRLQHSGPWITAEAFGVPGRTVLQRPVAIDLSGKAAPAPTAGPASDPVVSDSGELTWDSRDKQGVVLINTPRSKAVIGVTSKGPYRLGDVVIAPRPNLQNWAAITLTVMDGADRSGPTGFDAPGRLLVTATGYAENTAMGWKNEEKTTVGPDWGKAPSLVEGIPATIQLPVAADRVKVWALDERGQRAEPVSVRNEQGKAAFDLGPEHKTLWYEVEVK